MRNINCRKLQTIFLFISFYGLNCEDIQATRSKVQDSVIGSTYDVFQTLIEMSNYFERFPVNESYFETQFLSKVSLAFVNLLLVYYLMQRTTFRRQ